MENMNHSDNGAVVVKKNKRISILAFVGCLFLAFVIWFYVMNVKISDNSKTFTIKMDIRGETALLNERNYSVFGAGETWVKVTVQGTNTDLAKCSDKDFGVYIDVSDVENTGITPLNIVVESKSTAVSVVSTDPVQTTVFIDEKINEKKVPLVVDIEGGVVGDNRVIKVNTDVLGVGGPKAYVNEITTARILINTSDIYGGDEYSGYKVEFPVEFYDVANNVVRSPYIVYDPSDIVITVESDVNTEEGSETIVSQ